LFGIAVSGVHAAIAASVQIPAETQKIIDIQLIKLTRRIPCSALLNFMNRSKNLPITKLDLKGKAGWDDKLPICEKLRSALSGTYANITHVCTSINSKQGSSDIIDTPRIMHTMICPKCNYINTAQCSKLIKGNLEIKIKCSNCCKLTPSFEWKCNCSNIWHMCRWHANKAADIAGEANNNVTRAAVKRPRQSPSLEELLDDDLKRESRHAQKHQVNDIIDLGYITPKVLKLSMLSDSLRNRFPHAAYSS
jgi:hypothetical protein